MEKTMSKIKKIGETLALYNCSKCGKEFYFFQGMDESLVICDSCSTIQDQPEEVNNSQDKVQFKSEQDQPDKKDKKEKEVKKIIIKTGKGWDCESGVSYEDYLAGEVCKYFEGIEDRAREEGRKEELESLKKMWDNDELGDAPEYGRAGAGLMKRWFRNDIDARLGVLEKPINLTKQK